MDFLYSEQSWPPVSLRWPFLCFEENVAARFFLYADFFFTVIFFTPTSTVVTKGANGGNPDLMWCDRTWSHIVTSWSHRNFDPVGPRDLHTKFQDRTTFGGNWKVVCHKNKNKNEYFSRPAGQGGLHRDSQGSSLKDGFTGFFRFPKFVHFVKQKSPQVILVYCLATYARGWY